MMNVRNGTSSNDVYGLTWASGDRATAPAGKVWLDPLRSRYFDELLSNNEPVLTRRVHLVHNAHSVHTTHSITEEWDDFHV